MVGTLSVFRSGLSFCAVALCVTCASAQESAVRVRMAHGDIPNRLHIATVDQDTEPLSFNREPDATGAVIRSGLQLTPFSWEEGVSIGVFVDLEGKLLYIDQNRNLDLTDDGEPIALTEQGELSNALLADHVVVALPVGGQSVPHHLSMTVGIDSIWAELCSGWQGTFTVDAATYQVTVTVHLDGDLDSGASFQVQPEGSDLIPTHGFGQPVPELLILGGQPHAVNLSVEQGTPPVMEMTLTPADIPMGRLELSGKGLSYATLWESRLDALALLEATDDAIRFPAGSYAVGDVILTGGYRGRPPRDYQWSSESPLNKSLDIEPDGTATLQLGGPVSPTLKAERRSSSVHLTYELLGADGRAYSKPLDDLSDPPEFVVLKGAEEVHRGRFSGLGSHTWRVPWTVSGDLTFVARENVGDLGLVEGPPVAFHVSPWWRIAAWAPALIVLLLLLRKANRTPAAWWVLAPFLSTYLLTYLLAGLVAGAIALLYSISAVQLYVLLVASVLLLADCLYGRWTWLRLIFACLFVAVAGLSLQVALGVVDSVFVCGVGTGIGSLVTLACLWWAARCARRKRSGLRLALWLLIAHPVVLPFVVIPSLWIQAAMQGFSFSSGLGPMLFVVGSLSLASALMGLLMGAMLLPFVLLVWLSPFYRDRVFAAFTPAMRSPSTTA